jgi:hypothetical protein
VPLPWLIAIQVQKEKDILRQLESLPRQLFRDRKCLLLTEAMV